MKPTKKLLTATRQAPAPSKDILYLEVTPNLIKLTTVPINPRCLKFIIPPKTTEYSFQEFLDDSDPTNIHDKIKSLFPKEFDRIKIIAAGHNDILSILPEENLIKVIGSLSLEDVQTLENVSQPLKDLCQSNKFWELLYENHLGTGYLTKEMREIAGEMGWKKFYFSRKINTRRASKRASTLKREGSTLSNSNKISVDKIDESNQNEVIDRILSKNVSDVNINA